MNLSQGQTSPFTTLCHGINRLQLKVSGWASSPGRAPFFGNLHRNNITAGQAQMLCSVRGLQFSETRQISFKHENSMNRSRSCKLGESDFLTGDFFRCAALW
jgi:hypothetical protein